MMEPETCGRIWAFTYPSSVATHSLNTGTSRCSTVATSTSGVAVAVAARPRLQLDAKIARATNRMTVGRVALLFAKGGLMVVRLSLLGAIALLARVWNVTVCVFLLSPFA